MLLGRPPPTAQGVWRAPGYRRESGRGSSASLLLRVDDRGDRRSRGLRSSARAINQSAPFVSCIRRPVSTPTFQQRISASCVHVGLCAC
jgi:hypothetical protein